MKTILLAITILLIPAYTQADPSLFAPTPIDIVLHALKYINPTTKDTLIDLGCGDGRVLIAASQLYGCKSIGIDLDLHCIQLTSQNIQLNHLSHLITVHQQDILKTDLSQATIIYIYLQPELTTKLTPKLKTLKPGVKIIAHDKPIPNWTPTKTTKIKSTNDNQWHTIYYYHLKS